MELLNIWVVAVVLSFSNAPHYESHYQLVTFNSERVCESFLKEKKIELSHELIHIFDSQPEILIDINLNCKILEGDSV